MALFPSFCNAVSRVKEIFCPANLVKSQARLCSLPSPTICLRPRTSSTSSPFTNNRSKEPFLGLSFVFCMSIKVENCKGVPLATFERSSEHTLSVPTLSLCWKGCCQSVASFFACHTTWCDIKGSCNSTIASCIVSAKFSPVSTSVCVKGKPIKVSTKGKSASVRSVGITLSDTTATLLRARISPAIACTE